MGAIHEFLEDGGILAYSVGFVCLFVCFVKNGSCSFKSTCNSFACLHIVLLLLVLILSNSPFGQSVAVLRSVIFHCELIFCGFCLLLEPPCALAHESISAGGLCASFCWIPRGFCCLGIAFMLFSYVGVPKPFKQGKSRPQIQV